MVVFASDTEVPLLAAVRVPPRQVEAPAGAAVLVKPRGYVSVNDDAVMSTEFKLVNETVSKDVPFWPMMVGAKLFATKGAASTIRVAILLGAPGTASVECATPLA